MSKEAIVFFDLLKRPLSSSELDFYSSSHFVDAGKSVRKVLFRGEEYFTYLDQYTARQCLKEHLDASKVLWKKVERYASFMQLVPFVESISVCNNLALGAADEQSDIDLFVITRRGRMFFARFLLTICLHILAVRRHGSKVSGRFCLSFFVSEDVESFDSFRLKPFDPYLLFWMRSLKVLFGVDKLKALIDRNDWFKSKYMNLSDENLKYYKISKLSFLKVPFEFLFTNRFGDFVESQLSKWQLARANQKYKNLQSKVGTIITSKILKFHDDDKRPEFLERWRNAMNEL